MADRKERNRKKQEGGGAAAAGGFERLATLVQELIKRYQAQCQESAGLREKLHEASLRLDAHDAERLAWNAQRQDATKRIDELMAQLDHLEAELERRYKTAPSAEE